MISKTHFRFVIRSALSRGLHRNDNLDHAADQAGHILHTECEAIQIYQRCVVRDLLSPWRAAAIGLQNIERDLPADPLDRQGSRHSQRIAISSSLYTRALK